MKPPAKLKFALISFAAAGLAACTTFTKKECENMDWSQKGYETARDGRASKSGLDYFNANCAREHGVSPNTALFSAGYAQGLAEVCTRDGGASFGVRGIWYAGICPKEKEAAFMEGYRGGRLTYLEGEVTQLQERVRSLKSDLDTKQSIIDSLQNQVNNCAH